MRQRPRLEVPGTHLTLEPWDQRHLNDLVIHANNRAVSRNMVDSFPFPYTVEAGRDFITMSRAQVPTQHFAIMFEGRAIGGCGVSPYGGERRIVAELGYWLGVEYWGRGFATAATQRLVAYAWQTFPHLQRLEAGVFGWNGASARVLEKAGFTLDGTLRTSIVKDGEITDRLVFGLLRST